MQQTLAQKLIARAAGAPTIVGDVVTAKVDLAMIHDSGGPRRVEPLLKEWGVGLWDPAKVVLISDHFVPGDTEEGARILALTATLRQALERNGHDVTSPSGAAASGILSFRPETGSAGERVIRLRERGIHVAAIGEEVRVSPHVWVDESELGAFVSAL